MGRILARQVPKGGRSAPQAEGAQERCQWSARCRTNLAATRAGGRDADVAEVPALCGRHSWEELPLRREGLEAVQLHGEPDQHADHADEAEHPLEQGRAQRGPPAPQVERAEHDQQGKGGRLHFVGDTVWHRPARRAFVLGPGHAHFTSLTHRHRPGTTHRRVTKNRK